MVMAELVKLVYERARPLVPSAMQGFEATFQPAGTVQAGALAEDVDEAAEELGDDDEVEEIAADEVDDTEEAAADDAEEEDVGAALDDTADEAALDETGAASTLPDRMTAKRPKRVRVGVMMRG